jgi:NADH:ubiquinone oxidoreductase subunit F (NADH-binding)
VYVCKNPHEKAMQRALIQYRNPNNYELVREALLKAGREDLIGYDKKCLIRPRGGQKYGNDEKTFSKARKSQKESSKALPKEKAYGNGKKSGGKKKTIRNVHPKAGIGKSKK